MKINLKRGVAALAGLAAAASIVPVLAAPAAYAAPTDSGTANISPTSSNDSSQPFTIVPPAGAACPGDGGDGWRVTSYLVPLTVEPATLMFDTNGPQPQAYGTPQSDFRQPLYDAFGSPYTTGQPANKDPNAANPNEGKIINVPSFSFEVFGAQGSGFEVPPGEYNIGIACVVASGTSFPIDRFWNNTITVTASASDAGPAGISWAQGVVDAAPVLDSLTPGDGTLTATFTHAPSDLANTSYTATATPDGGGTAVTKTGSGSPITIDALTNGTAYAVTVRASNLAGDSPESNALTNTPLPGAQPAVQNLTATPDPTPDSGIVDVDWDAPVGGESTPTGYEVTVSPSGGTVVVDNVDLSAQVSGLTAGTPYTFTVIPQHASPYVGTPASVEATPVATGVTILEQNVSVERPAGAVVFTQRCETDSAGNAVTGQPFAADPCAIVFGVADRILDPADPRRGRYFEASASLNNVQVDAWGDDTGWTVTGDMSEFVHEAHLAAPAGAPTNMRFSGDQLGWTPAPVSLTDGLVVAMGAPVPAETAAGMSASPTLASSVAGQSLGIAEFDAALELLIPVQKRAGEYFGTLTMTATPGV